MAMFCKCPHCAHRCELPLLFEREGFKVGVEVGVLHGNYSRSLLSRWSGLLHLIDPWRNYEGYDELMSASPGLQDHEHNLQETMKVLSGFHPRRYKVHRTFSNEYVADQIGTVDFAYIDGNHALKWVTQDLEVWWQHVRPGGILAGHDLFQVGVPDVTEALVLFANRVGAEVFMVPGKDGCPCGEGGVPSWYIRKEG